MLLPKIQRKSMLKAMCRNPPCMNIEVKMVSHQGASSRGTKPDSGSVLAPRSASAYSVGPLADDVRPRCSDDSAPSAQSSPGVSSR